MKCNLFDLKYFQLPCLPTGLVLLLAVMLFFFVTPQAVLSEPPISVLGGVAVEWYHDGGIDWAPAIQAAINDVAGLSNRAMVKAGASDEMDVPGGVIWLKPRTYVVYREITIPHGTNGLIFRGSGKGQTIIQAGAPMMNVLHSAGTSSDDGRANFNLEIADLTIDGNGKAGIGLHWAYTYHSTMRNIEVRNSLSHGIMIELGFYNTGYDLRCRSNGGNGLHLRDTANANTFIGGHFRQNTGYGIYVGRDGGAGSPHGVNLIGTTVESNMSGGIMIDDADEVRMMGIYFESFYPDTKAIEITGSEDNKSNWCVINGCNFAGEESSIKIDYAKGTIVTGNSINNGLELTSNCDLARIYGNARIENVITEDGINTYFLVDAIYSDRWYIKNGSDVVWSWRAGGVGHVQRAGKNFMQLEIGDGTIGLENGQHLRRYSKTYTVTSLTAGSTHTISGDDGKPSIPSGSMVTGVVARVIEDIIGPSYWKIGDTTDASRWSSNRPTTAGTMSNYQTAGTQRTPLIYPGGENLVLTAIDGTFAGGTGNGVVRITIFYDVVGSPTD